MADNRFTLPPCWPAPYDEGAAERVLERIAETNAAPLADLQPAAAMLRALGGNSVYLGDLAVREADALVALAAEGPDAVLAVALGALRATPFHASRLVVSAAMRRAKRVIALLAAIADIGGIWNLERVTGALSDLAEATLGLAVDHLLRAAHDQGDLVLPDPHHPHQGSGFIVLGMGKLGARELNYSSDIDLILIHDPDAGIHTERTDGDASRAFMSRLGRGLVALMETRDAEGYVFRTDLRLRPDPAVTPPVVSLPAAITYYESMGQNWERAAMIKARPVAGDREAGAAFLEAIRPFVWRHGLDFAAVADIDAMKRRIDHYKGGALGDGVDPVARIAGHDVKLGEGGIREIEFLAQTLQLVWGGRAPALREPTTLGALALLANAGRLSPAAADDLCAAYRFLRAVEHRLQMVADRQTHTLPERPPELDRIARFLGFSDTRAFAHTLLEHFGRVRARYAEIFETVPESGRGEGFDFRGDGPAPAATTEGLARLGFADAGRIVSSVRGWQAGRFRALRSDRARHLLDRLLPDILGALVRQPQPDLAFSRFDELLSRLPAGVQLLSLFQRNPGLLDRIAAVLGAAPTLADHLARHPSALEGLLAETGEDKPASLLNGRLGDARLLEDAIAITRRLVREEDFAVSVATLEGRIDTDEAGLRRSAIADATIEALLPAVLGDFAERNGRIRGGEMAVVLLGKAGGREMMAGSDLDLLLLYDHPEEATESVGGVRSMAPSQWFVRAAHAFVAAITASGADGPLYAVDMRLRPSGNKGPVAVSMAAFRRYHRSDAWTWERMALTRARVVAGPAALRQRAEEAIAEAIEAADGTQVLADAAAMRGRMLRDLPADGPWDVKLRAGGLVEVEFVAQALQLVHARALGAARSPTTRIALAYLAGAGVLTPEDAMALTDAGHLFRTVQGLLRLTLGRAHPDALPPASARPLLRATGAGDLPDLRARLDAAARKVRATFTKTIGEVPA